MKIKILFAILAAFELNLTAAPNDVIDKYFELTDKQKHKEAIALMMPYAQQKDDDAELKVGWAYIQLGDYAEGMKWYKSSASKGNEIAMSNLGSIYYNMFDYQQAYSRYSDAAKKNYAPAIRMLGIIHYDPDGNTVKYKDYRKSFDFFSKAAKLDDNVAQYYLGLSYLESHGVAQDKNKAIEWLKKAAKNGEKRAQAILDSIGVR